MSRPYVLTIAGHDPSGGAGLNADCKTFEQFKTLGLSVCTALTVQNENEFLTVEWIKTQDIKKQLEVLLHFYPVKYIKIGLIESFEVLIEVLDFIKNLRSDTMIIWDPILRSTSGFTFHNTFDRLNVLLQNVDLITPNRNEIAQLTGLTNGKEAAKMLSKHVSVLLKGGHAKDHATDMLYQNGEKTFEIEGDRFKSSDKHGTGCVLSAAIVANLGLGYDLKFSCREGKKYVEFFLQSNSSRLGYHT